MILLTKIHIGSNNGPVPSVNKPLLETAVTKLLVVTTNWVWPVKFALGKKIIIPWANLIKSVGGGIFWVSKWDL